MRGRCPISTATISERDGKITNLTTEIDSLEKRLEAMQNEVGKSESFQFKAVSVGCMHAPVSGG